MLLMVLSKLRFNLAQFTRQIIFKSFDSFPWCKQTLIFWEKTVYAI